MSRAQLIGWMMISGAMLAGCTQDIEQLRRDIDQIKRQDAPPLQSIPAMKDYDRYTYQSVGLRDPFISGEQVGNTGASTDTNASCNTDLAPDPNRPPELLEQFPLDSLDMVGTLKMGPDNYGIVKDPDGVVHRVLAGNFMGQNDGRIVAIRDDRIELDERVADGNGCWEAKSAEIALEDSVR